MSGHDDWNRSLTFYYRGRRVEVKRMVQLVLDFLFGRPVLTTGHEHEDMLFRQETVEQRLERVRMEAQASLRRSHR